MYGTVQLQYMCNTVVSVCYGRYQRSSCPELSGLILVDISQSALLLHWLYVTDGNIPDGEQPSTLYDQCSVVSV